MFFTGLGLAFVITPILTLIFGKGLKKFGFADLLGCTGASPSVPSPLGMSTGS